MALPTAPTLATGNRTTLAGIQSARRVVEMADVIYRYDDAQDTPFLTTLQNRLNASVSGNPKFQHLEDSYLPRKTTLASSYSGGTETTLAVATGTGSYFVAGNLALLPTSAAAAAPGELIYISSVSGDNLGVVRNFNGDGVTGGAVVSGDNIMIVGNTNKEFATLPAIITTQEAVVQNYCQIIRTAYAVSDTLEASRLYGGNDLQVQRVKGARQHRLDCERAFLFGKPSEQSDTRRTTGGLLYWIATNKVNAGGTLTPSTMESFAAKLFRYSQRPKLLMASRTVVNQLDLIAEGRIETMVGADTYGVAVKRYQTAHGDLNVVAHDMLVDDFSGYAVAIDVQNVGIRFMQGAKGARNARLETNRQDPSADGTAEEYLSEIGLHVKMEATHGILYGVS